MEGLILKAFIENQRRPKTQIAKALGMSKQHLYQLFDSKKLEDGTIKNIESVFKVKWTQIKASVNIDGNIAPTDSNKPQQGSNPEKQGLDLIKEVNQLRDDQLRIMATLKVLVSEIGPLIAKENHQSKASASLQLEKDISEMIESLKTWRDKKLSGD